MNKSKEKRAPSITPGRATILKYVKDSRFVVPIAQISREVGVSRQYIYKIKKLFSIKSRITDTTRRKNRVLAKLSRDTQKAEAIIKLLAVGIPNTELKDAIRKVYNVKGRGYERIRYKKVAKYIKTDGGTRGCVARLSEYGEEYIKYFQLTKSRI